MRKVNCHVDGTCRSPPGKRTLDAAAQSLRTAAEIGLRVAKTIEDYRFTFARNEENIKAEALLDDLYVVRTSLPEETIADRVETYKSFAKVERAFRSLQ